MKVTAPLRLQFGKLAYIRGLVTYRLSPFEQRAFAGFIKSIGRTAYRIKSSFFQVTVPISLVWLACYETNKKYDKMIRKNPEDYVNDK